MKIRSIVYVPDGDEQPKTDGLIGQPFEKNNKVIGTITEVEVNKKGEITVIAEITDEKAKKELEKSTGVLKVEAEAEEDEVISDPTTGRIAPSKTHFS